jgi:hypothetical protein
MQARSHTTPAAPDDIEVIPLSSSPPAPIIQSPSPILPHGAIERAPGLWPDEFVKQFDKLAPNWPGLPVPVLVLLLRPREYGQPVTARFGLRQPDSHALT